MFWPFVDARGRLEYCPLADFGGVGLREGADLTARVAVAEPVAAHEELRNPSELAGCIAIVQRGQCDFVAKALRAQRAGAVAVLVANSPSRGSGGSDGDDDSAFVMDAGGPGRHSPEELAEIRIPAMMMPFNLAASVLEQARAAAVEHRECSLTIKLLGAQQAAWVLEQRQRATVASLEAEERRLDEAQRQEQRQRRQREATKVLRSRLDGLGGSPSSAAAPRRGQTSPKTGSLRSADRAKAAKSVAATSDVASVASEAFTEPLTTRMRRWELESDLFDLESNNFDDDDDDGTSRSCSSEGDRKRSHSSTSSVSSGSHCTPPGVSTDHRVEALGASTQSFVSSSSGPMTLHPLCPMTTALVVLDVQNQFVLREPAARPLHSRRRNAHAQHESSARRAAASGKTFRYAVENELLPTIQDVLLASRACEGVEVVYSVVESATRDGRERSPAYKRAGIHVTRGGFGAQVPSLIAPDPDRDFVLPRPGINVFEATNLDFLLRNLSISHVVIVGLDVLGSVDTCVQSAIDRGYHVTLIADALLDCCISETSRHKSAAPAGNTASAQTLLSRLGKRGAQVVDASAFVHELHSFSC